MRHLHGYRKLGRNSAHRKAMLRNMATSIVMHDRIATTLPKAKELRGVVERCVTLGKRGDLHARRTVAARLYTREAVEKVFGDLATRFKTRPGGYTRIVRTGIRPGDGAKLAIIEFVDYDDLKKASSGTEGTEAATKKGTPAKKKATVKAPAAPKRKAAAG